MTLANSQPDITPRWEIRYQASEYLNVESLEQYSKIADFVNNLNVDTKAYEKLVKYYYTEGPMYEIGMKDSRLFTYLKCRMLNDDFYEFFRCISWITYNLEEYAFDILNHAGGAWYKRIPG
jgi:predicted restriction endonuclease